MKNNIITGLDIGTSKTCAVIAEASPDGTISIKGAGVSGAKGVNKGFISSLDKAADSIVEAVESAEEKAGIKAHTVVTNISGASVAGRIEEAAMLLSRHGREITRHDIAKVLQTARSVSLPLGRDFLYAAAQEFIVDDNAGVEDPLGLFGSRLKVSLYVISALSSQVQNISKVINYAGYELLDVVPGVVALASSILDDKHKKDGAIIIDIGGGITELAIFYGGALRFLDSVNIGGMDLTAHLSAHFKMPFDNAETIKTKYGSLFKEDMTKDRKNIFDINDRRIVINSDVVNKLLAERAEEVFYIIKERLLKSCSFTNPIPSLVVTGGCALLNGALESLEDFFTIPVSMGRINGVAGPPELLSNPIYSVAISLAKGGLARYSKPKFPKGKSFLFGIFSRLKDLLDEYF